MSRLIKDALFQLFIKSSKKDKNDYMFIEKKIYIVFRNGNRKSKKEYVSQSPNYRKDSSRLNFYIRKRLLFVYTVTAINVNNSSDDLNIYNSFFRFRKYRKYVKQIYKQSIRNKKIMDLKTSGFNPFIKEELQAEIRKRKLDNIIK